MTGACESARAATSGGAGAPTRRGHGPCLAEERGRRRGRAADGPARRTSCPGQAPARALPRVDRQCGHRREQAPRLRAPATGGSGGPRRGRAFSPLGPASPASGGGLRGRPHDPLAGARRLLRGAGLVAAGARYRFRLDGAAPSPIPPRGSSPTGRTARPRWSTPQRSPGPTPRGPASQRTATCSTSCTSARSPPRAPGPRRRRGSPRPRRARHHDAGAHAGRRLRRPVRLGLRRRQPVRADPALRHARRPAPVRRPRPRRSGSA